MREPKSGSYAKIKLTSMDEKVQRTLKYVLVKTTQGNLQIYISLGLKNQTKIDQNGTKHVIIVFFPQGN